MTRPVARWKMELGALATPPRRSPQPQAALPTFLAIARRIADDARSGRLPSGARIPGSRELAAQLGVHRNTVLAAYRELLAEGFLETEPGRGTFVARSLPPIDMKRGQTGAKAQASPAEQPGFTFEPAHTPAPFQAPPPHLLMLYGGLPDT